MAADPAKAAGKKAELLAIHHTHHLGQAAGGGGGSGGQSSSLELANSYEDDLIREAKTVNVLWELGVLEDDVGVFNENDYAHLSEADLDALQALTDICLGVSLSEYKDYNDAVLHAKKFLKKLNNSRAVNRLVHTFPFDAVGAKEEVISIIHLAAFNNHVEILQACLQVEGADVNVRSANGFVPLHYACEQGFTDVIRLLLENTNPLKRGDVKAQDYVLHDTPAHCLLRNKKLTSDCIYTNLLLLLGKRQNARGELVEDNKWVQDKCNNVGKTVTILAQERVFFDNRDNFVKSSEIRGWSNSNPDVEAATTDRTSDDRSSATSIAVKQAVHPSMHRGFLRCVVLLLRHDKKNKDEDFRGDVDGEADSSALSPKLRAIRGYLFAFLFILVLAAIISYLVIKAKNHHTCTQLDKRIYGVLLTPYLIVLMNQFLFRLFKHVFEFTIIPFIDKTLQVYMCYYCKFCCAKAAAPATTTPGSAPAETANPMSSREDEDNASVPSASPDSPAPRGGRGGPTSHTQSRRMLAWRVHHYKSYLRNKKSSSYRGDDAILQVPWLFLYAQIFASLIVLVLVLRFLQKWSADAEKDTGNDPLDASDWDRYTTLYGILVNSALTTSAFSMYLFFTHKRPKTFVRQRNAMRTSDGAAVSNSLTLQDAVSDEQAHVDEVPSSTVATLVPKWILDALLHAYSTSRGFISFVRSLCKLCSGKGRAELWSFCVDNPKHDTRLQQLTSSLMNHKTAFTLCGRQVTYSVFTWCVLFLLLVQVLVILPPIVTHIFPAFVLYGWILLLGWVLFESLKHSGNALLRRWGIDYSRYRSSLGGASEASTSRTLIHSIWFLLDKVLERFVAIFIFQTLFNYATLSYDNHPYLDIISTEFRLRSEAYCFLKLGYEGVLRNNILFFSWL